MRERTARALATTISDFVALEEMLAVCDTGTPAAHVVTVADAYVAAANRVRAALAQAERDVLQAHQDDQTNIEPHTPPHTTRPDSR